MTTPSARFGELPSLELPACLDFLKLKSFPLKVFPAVNEPERPVDDTLFIYGPGYRNSEASFDVDCLIIQMYLAFCGIEHKVYNINAPEASPSGQLPFLATVSGAIYDSPQTINWVKETRKLEKESDNEQAKAFIALVQNKLKSALLFSMWMEPLNATEITHKAYFGHVASPVNKVLAFQKQNQVVQSLLTDRDILVREEIYQDAAQTLEALSVKLGDQPYFFNASEPTFVDAVIFSHLHCILSMPKIVDGQFTEEEKRQASTLSKLVRKHDNLVRYAKTIFDGYIRQTK
ncbi:uncharacterized protein EV154DRAFT_516915 [Mucor mucedo]|uniref:uncharacterized protein n=1 Tax=Mucor mucedo TaxID=29922 RepID=UPI00222013EB|nr:uncharacterized protein EV154DRAFT_516915 [Mucor mucedo]KAI7888665.1 hypothetical protein EV154DRAFT_516915 [Mucor mucedo]